MSRRTTAISAALLLTSALWLFFLSVAQAQIDRGPPPSRTPDRGPSSTPIPGATPTIDRLAAPPTVPVPNQADEGAQVYWHNCQPCHGDVGQGLTDEWRAQYPEEEQNCWKSGCHGKDPYDLDNRLPTAVPAVIGEGALAKFGTMEQVYNYIRVSMPYFYPGTLSEEEYLALAAHLARENGLWDGQTLTVNNLNRYTINPLVNEPAPTPVPVATAAAPSVTAAGDGPRMNTTGWIAIGIAALFVAGGLLAWLKHNR